MGRDLSPNCRVGRWHHYHHISRRPSRHLEYLRRAMYPYPPESRFRRQLDQSKMFFGVSWALGMRKSTRGRDVHRMRRPEEDTQMLFVPELGVNRPLHKISIDEVEFIGWFQAHGTLPCLARDILGGGAATQAVQSHSNQVGWKN